MWTEMPKGKNKKPVNKDRFISKMFLRYVQHLTSRTHCRQLTDASLVAGTPSFLVRSSAYLSIASTDSYCSPSSPSMKLALPSPGTRATRSLPTGSAPTLYVDYPMIPTMHC
jgi:hypothetical protein